MSSAHNRAHALAVGLLEAADTLTAEVAALPPALIDWKPAEDVWSVMEIICHVDEFVPYWTEQTLQVVRHPDQLWGRDHTDERRLGAVRQAGSRTPGHVLSSIGTHARAAAESINGLTDADLDLEAASRNPRWGHRPASFIVDHLLVQHVLKHIGQVRRNVAQYQETQREAR